MAGWHQRSRVFELDVGEAQPVRCHAVIAGPPDGRPLVLIHGIAVSSWAWRKNLEPLAARGFRVVALCQKGHGWSGRGAGAYDLAALSRFVLAALDHLHIACASFVGNSLGGAVALWTALHAPERVERLVLIDPACHRAQIPWPLLSAPVTAFAAVTRALGPTPLRVALSALAYKHLPIDREYLAGFMAPYQTAGSMRAVMATARALPAAIATLDRRLGEIRHPTLVIWGEKDGLLPVQSAWRFVRKVPHARLVVVPEAAHCPHEESPERVNQLIADELDAVAG